MSFIQPFEVNVKWVIIFCIFSFLLGAALGSWVTIVLGVFHV